jgi:PEGA domain
VRGVGVATAALCACAVAGAEEPVTGQLVVVSEPDGAAIAIDTEPAGTGPLKRDVQPGEHLVEATWPGGKRVTQVVRVVAGSSVVARLADGPRAPGPPPVEAPARLTRSTIVELTGPQANPEKQEACDAVLVAYGWARDANAPVKARIELAEDANQLVVTYFGQVVARQPLGNGVTKSLCHMALRWVESALAGPPPRVKAVKPPPEVREGPKGAPPQDRDLQAFLDRKAPLLAQCRDAYAKGTRGAQLRAVVTPAGAVTVAELVDGDNATRFANCVSRIAQQAHFPAWRGRETTLRAAVRFP